MDPVPSKSLADHVADALREAIDRGDHAPGERLVERTLARQLGVSHIPVREALARLADEGLVERLPRRGSRVATLTPRELEELSSLRVVLEQYVVVRVQERLTPALEAQLRRTVEAMRAAAAGGDVRRVLDLDQRLHAQLWAQAEHAVLSELVAQLRRRIAAFLRAATAALEPEQLERHVASHLDLIDAIAGDDPDAARVAMAQHVETAAARLRDVLETTAAAPTLTPTTTHEETP